MAAVEVLLSNVSAQVGQALQDVCDLGSSLEDRSSTLHAIREALEAQPDAAARWRQQVGELGEELGQCRGLRKQHRRMAAELAKQAHQLAEEVRRRTATPSSPATVAADVMQVRAQAFDELRREVQTIASQAHVSAVEDLHREIASLAAQVLQLQGQTEAGLREAVGANLDLLRRELAAEVARARVEDDRRRELAAQAADAGALEALRGQVAAVAGQVVEVRELRRLVASVAEQAAGASDLEGLRRQMTALAERAADASMLEELRRQVAALSGQVPTLRNLEDLRREVASVVAQASLDRAAGASGAAVAMAFSEESTASRIAVERLTRQMDTLAARVEAEIPLTDVLSALRGEVERLQGVEARTLAELEGLRDDVKFALERTSGAGGVAAAVKAASQEAAAARAASDALRRDLAQLAARVESDGMHDVSDSLETLRREIVRLQGAEARAEAEIAGCRADVDALQADLMSARSPRRSQLSGGASGVDMVTRKDLGDAVASLRGELHSVAELAVNGNHGYDSAPALHVGNGLAPEDLAARLELLEAQVKVLSSSSFAVERAPPQEQDGGEVAVVDEKCEQMREQLHAFARRVDQEQAAARAKVDAAMKEAVAAGQKCDNLEQALYKVSGRASEEILEVRQEFTTMFGRILTDQVVGAGGAAVALAAREDCSKLRLQAEALQEQVAQLARRLPGSPTAASTLAPWCDGGCSGGGSPGAAPPCCERLRDDLLALSQKVETELMQPSDRVAEAARRAAVEALSRAAVQTAVQQPNGEIRGLRSSLEAEISDLRQRVAELSTSGREAPTAPAIQAEALLKRLEAERQVEQEAHQRTLAKVDDLLGRLSTLEAGARSGGDASPFSPAASEGDASGRRASELRRERERLRSVEEFVADVRAA